MLRDLLCRTADSVIGIMFGACALVIGDLAMRVQKRLVLAFGKHNGCCAT